MNRVNKTKSNIDKNVGTNRKSDNRATEGNEATAFNNLVEKLISDPVDTKIKIPG